MSASSSAPCAKGRLCSFALRRRVPRAPLPPAAAAAAPADAADDTSSSRRAVVLLLPSLALGVASAARPRAASAFSRPPPGYELWTDGLDGYSLYVPADWVQVKSAGADVFFRAPLKVEQNLFVEASSPSSTKFESVAQLGPPEEAGEKLVAQYLTEFQSTRLGVKRDAKLVSASTRPGPGGVPVLDAEVHVKSFANEQQYGVSAENRGPQKLEWDRRLFATLAVANGRLYALRMQCNEEDLASARPQFDAVRASFTAFPVVG